MLISPFLYCSLILLCFPESWNWFWISDVFLYLLMCIHHAAKWSQTGNIDGCICAVPSEHFGNYLLYPIFLVILDLLEVYHSLIFNYFILFFKLSIGCMNNYIFLVGFSVRCWYCIWRVQCRFSCALLDVLSKFWWIYVFLLIPHCFVSP